MEYLDLIIFVTLLTVGYVVGQWLEKRHFKSIMEREERYRKLLTFNERFPPKELKSVNVELVGGNVVISIDYFKRINDEHGHIIGDQVLKTVVDFCRDNLRKYDSIYRFGGEEFLFLLPEADLNEAQIIIERLCTTLGKHPISLTNGEQLSVTASFGIACMQKDASVDDTIQSADHALLCAKSRGRNRVCSWEDGLSNYE